MDIKGKYTFDDNRLALQDEFERLILRIEQKPRPQRYQRAISILDEFWRDNASRDSDGWLRRSMLLTRAIYLKEMGRVEDAAHECEELAEFGLATRYEVIELAREWALVLENLGRYEEAIDVLERGLREVIARVPQPALTLLHIMNRAYEALGRPVPECHIALFLASIGAQNIEITEDLDTHPQHFGQAIVAAFEKRRQSP